MSPYLLILLLIRSVLCSLDMSQVLIEKEKWQSVSLPSVWQLLGPFQIGTREASWGADPLEYYGGFSSLKPVPGVTFPSSLTPNGTAGWSTLNIDSLGSTQSYDTVSLNVRYPQVDWAFLRTVYGWAATQFQAWARGEIVVRDDLPQTILLYTASILEFRIDGKSYFGGDFYAFRKVPLVLHLEPGTHTIEVRLVRDVRAMGGVGNTAISVKIEAQTTSSTIDIPPERNLISHVVNGSLASPFASIAIRNNDLSEIGIYSVDTNDTTSSITTVTTSVTSVFPGQTRPLALRVNLHDPNATAIRLNVYYWIRSKDSREQTKRAIEVILPLMHKTIDEPHKVTHMHPAGIVSYSIVRPPSAKAQCPGKSAPVLLQLHGAGVEAESDAVAHTMDPLPDLCAFVVFPTGVTPWSGDDWHTWGFADVEAAVNNLPLWVSNNRWHGTPVDITKWFVAGHSNGGQGTWYAVTHRPDKVFAAAPVSGYLSIQTYVPYHLWQPMDPAKRAILEAATVSYRNELLASNAKGIPLYQQHGSADDNVPAYHSRFMHQALAAVGVNSTYNELPGKGHYFDGVMTTDGLRSFYEQQFQRSLNVSTPDQEFEMIVANPADMGSKSGLKVTQLITPGELGRVHASIGLATSSYTLKTSNILAVEVHPQQGPLKFVVIDNQTIALSKNQDSSINLVKSSDGSWADSTNTNAPSGLQTRHGRQLGAMDAILASNGSFFIEASDDSVVDTAILLSRNLYQYFSADARISVHSAECKNCTFEGDGGYGNRISVVVGPSATPAATFASFPITIDGGKVSVKDSSGSWHEYGSTEEVAAIYLSPLDGERLELIVWGADRLALDLAARLVPMMTGVGQPDFVILGKSTRWKGVEGALAMGFFDYKWNVSRKAIFT